MAYDNNQEESDAKLARKLNQEEADAELARKLAQQDMIHGQNVAHAPYANGTRNMPSTNISESSNNLAHAAVANCPGSHGLTQFIVSHAQRVSCDQCHRRLDENEDVYSCIICNYDICTLCYRSPSSIRPAASTTTTTTSLQPSSRQQRATSA